MQYYKYSRCPSIQRFVETDSLRNTSSAFTKIFKSPLRLKLCILITMERLLIIIGFNAQSISLIFILFKEVWNLQHNPNFFSFINPEAYSSSIKLIHLLLLTLLFSVLFYRSLLLLISYKCPFLLIFLAIDIYYPIGAYIFEVNNLRILYN